MKYNAVENSILKNESAPIAHLSVNLCVSQA